MSANSSKKFYHSLSFKVGAVIILLEIIILSIIGASNIINFNTAVDARAETQIKIPGQLMNAGELKLDAIQDNETMREIIGEELLNGLIAGIGGTIYYSLNPEYLGQDINAIPEIDPTLFNVNRIREEGELIIYKQSNIICITLLFAADKITPTFFVYIEMGNSAAIAQKNQNFLIFSFGSVFTLGFTMIIIYSSLRHFVFKPINRTIDVLNQIQKGNLNVRINSHISLDEIGHMQLGVNLMVHELQEHRENLEEIVKQRTIQLISANDELKQIQAELIEKEKLAVLGLLASGMAHEFRNPLGTIASASYFVKMAIQNPSPELKETLEIVDKEIQVLKRIIENLLDFTQPKPPILHEMQINNILQEIISCTKIPREINLIMRLEQDLPFIMADPHQLTQAFNNLIRNAIQAMPDGGQLIIKSERVKKEWVEISIIDTGVGILKENFDKLFEPLFTTKAKGIGLGLAITDTIINAQNGTIKVQSKVNKGSTFTVRLSIASKTPNRAI